MTTPLTEAREAEIRADCEKAFVHQMDSERTVREDRELLLTALDSERAKVAELVNVVRMIMAAAMEYRRLSTHDTDCYREWVKADEKLEAAFAEAAKDVTP